jgi:CDP-diacylglycerol--glycerol-3-phosphate 3-phosphatidyltransferase
MIRLAMAPAYLLLLSSCERRAAAVIAEAILVAAISTDALDGYFARKLNQTSNLGILLDPIADKLLIIPALILMSSMGWLPVWAVIIIISRELVVSSLRLLAASSGVILAAGFSGKAKTVAEYLLLAAATIRLGSNSVSYPLAWICAALATLSAIEYFYKNRGLLAGLFAPEEKE